MARERWKGLIGQRRQIIAICTGLLLGPGLQTVVISGQPDEAIEIAQTKLLSDRGSTRATRYASTNKIVTIDDKTHVAWLDSISNTMIATYDHASRQWGHPVKVGSGTDNHGGPALSCDSRGYLHIIFGPHADVPFQHCRSARRNDATEWIKQAGHMMSRDRGKTWNLADGSPLALPVGAKSDAFFARTNEAFKVINVVCDSTGHPWISLADARSEAGPTIYHHNGKTWDSFCPARLATSKAPWHELAFDGSLSIDSQDRIYVALTRGSRVTGGIKGDVVLLCSADLGKSFGYLKVFPRDGRLPHTGLSLERPTFCTRSCDPNDPG